MLLLLRFWSDRKERILMYLNTLEYAPLKGMIIIEARLSEIMKYQPLSISQKDLADIYDAIEFYASERYGVLTAQEMRVLRNILAKIEKEFTETAEENVTVHNYGHRNAGRRPTYPHENTEQIINLHTSGLSVRAIAQQVGCSAGRVESVIRKYREASCPKHHLGQRASFWKWYDNQLIIENG